MKNKAGDSEILEMLFGVCFEIPNFLEEVGNAKN